MSETPNCLMAMLGATCYLRVTFCYQNSGGHHKFLGVLVTQMMESKRRVLGSNEIEGSLVERQLKCGGI